MCLGLDSTATSDIEICAGDMQYIDFSIPASDYNGRMIYNNVDASFAWLFNGPATTRMSLNATTLYGGGTRVSSSDERLKFNEKPLTHAHGITNQLQPDEYDQTHDLTENKHLRHRSLINATS